MHFGFSWPKRQILEFSYFLASTPSVFPMMKQFSENFNYSDNIHTKSKWVEFPTIIININFSYDQRIPQIEPQDYWYSLKFPNLLKAVFEYYKKSKTEFSNRMYHFRNTC